MPPKSILKRSSTFPTRGAAAGPSGPGGAKLKQTVSIGGTSSKPSKSSQGKRREQGGASDEDDIDDDEDEGEGADEEELSTGDEIERAKEKGSKKKVTKRKAPTTADTFGATLTSLLSEPAGPSKRPKIATTTDSTATAPTVPVPAKAARLGAAPILSLSRAPVPPSRAQLSLERRAARVLKAEKTEREDRARVRDVVEGWSHPGGGMEFEKGLRKTAQRGVIKLFNAILVASKSTEEVLTSQPLSARAGVKAEKAKSGEKDNVLGRGGKEELTKERFLDLVRKGGR